MDFGLLDAVIIGAYLVFALAMGPVFSRLARRTTTDFFLSGRALPWWLSGTSMVATTFGADTPLLICGFIWAGGVYMNWWWWSFALSNVMTVVFFARLWRRAKVTTDAEFSELRYGGAAGAWLRGFRAAYFGGLVNTLIMAWLMFGAFGITATLLGADPAARGSVPVWLIVMATVGVVTIYTSMSGLWGVVITDLVQFAIAMVSCIVLAVLVAGRVGGMGALAARVAELHPLKEGALHFFPTPDLKDIPWMLLGSFFLFQWWCSYYPGSEPGGGAYVAQRMLASRTEKHSQLATLWFTVAHYALRPWPWIIVSLATVVLYPHLITSTAPNVAQLRELTYVRTIVDFVPGGWKGLMVAFLCAAFMSTLDTHLNLGASYLVRDLYARFLRPGRTQRHYVAASQVVMVVTVLVSAAAAIFLLRSIGDANRFLVGLMAGIGLVFVLRFYWWRVNAWSEISAMVGAVAVNSVLQFWVAEQPWFHALVPNPGDRGGILLSAGATIVNALWIIVTLLTPPESREVLHRFYRRVRPPGPGWRRVAAECGLEHEGMDPKDFLAFAGGLMLIWGALYFVGKLLFRHWAAAAVGLAITLAGGALTYVFLIRKADRQDTLAGEQDASEREVMDDSYARPGPGAAP